MSYCESSWPAQRHWLALLLGIAAVLQMAACDKFMRLDVRVSDISGAAVAGANVRVAIAEGGRDLTRDQTDPAGAVEAGTTYGFRSGPRILVVSKDGYKPFETRLTPAPAYTCHVVIARADGSESSKGECESAVQQ